MAKYTITHSCGHSHVHNIGGRIKDRPRKAKKLSCCLCPACGRKKRAEDYLARTEEEAKLIEDLEISLPSLEGSPRQIFWADKLRNSLITGYLEDQVVKRLNPLILPPLNECVFIELVRTERRAKWYISNLRDVDKNIAYIYFIRKHFATFIAYIEPHVMSLPKGETNDEWKEIFLQAKAVSNLPAFFPRECIDGIFTVLTREAMIYPAFLPAAQPHPESEHL